MLNVRNLLLLVLSVSLLNGCVNTPAQTAGVKDDRPMIMFEAARSGDLLILDGIEIGSANQFLSGQSALMIEPGTHRLEIIRDGAVILSERFYISRGSSKSFTVQGGK
ncbi:MAG: hypothetical protein ACR2PT_07955 [Endozoicomonas sp.]